MRKATNLGRRVRSLSDPDGVSGGPHRFVRVHVRAAGDSPYALRFQYGLKPPSGEPQLREDAAVVSKALVMWINERPYTGLSLADSGAKYTECRVRCSLDKPDYVRVQIPGPQINRDYGVCFTVKAHGLYNNLQMDYSKLRRD